MNLFSNSILTYFNIETCYFQSDQLCDFSKLPRPFFIISRWENGKAVYKTKTECISLNKGDIFFIPLGEKYTATFSGENIYCTSVFFNFASSNSKIKYNLQKINIKSQTDNDILSSLFALNNIRNTLTDIPAFDEISIFYKACSAIFTSLKYTTVNKNLNLIEPAVNYINTHITENISIKKLAAMCHLSESHFYHTFKNLTGVTPVTYKNRNAVNFAINLIKSRPELSISEIGYLSGFASDIYFRKVFKAYTGKTPKEFKHMDIM